VLAEGIIKYNGGEDDGDKVGIAQKIKLKSKIKKYLYCSQQVETTKC